MCGIGQPSPAGPHAGTAHLFSQPAPEKSAGFYHRQYMNTTSPASPQRIRSHRAQGNSFALSAPLIYARRFIATL